MNLKNMILQRPIKMRVSVKISQMHVGVICDICKANRPKNVMLIHFSGVPYALYVKILRGEITDNYRIKKMKETTCELTGKKFVPDYARCICEKCYLEHFRAREVK